jgi:hypothetical protein
MRIKFFLENDDKWIYAGIWNASDIKKLSCIIDPKSDKHVVVDSLTSAILLKDGRENICLEVMKGIENALKGENTRIENSGIIESLDID